MRVSLRATGRGLFLSNRNAFGPVQDDENPGADPIWVVGLGSGHGKHMISDAMVLK